MTDINKLLLSDKTLYLSLRYISLSRFNLKTLNIIIAAVYPQVKNTSVRFCVCVCLPFYTVTKLFNQLETLHILQYMEIAWMTSTWAFTD